MCFAVIEDFNICYTYLFKSISYAYSIFAIR